MISKADFVTDVVISFSASLMCGGGILVLMSIANVLLLIYRR